jgi:putative DNA-invertase from lambdoid prophage Rac
MKVAIYTRVSTGKQDYENQISQLKEYCKKQNYEVYKIFSETISGKESNRPIFKEMLSEASKRRFDAVLVWALDRFTREGTSKVWYYINLLNNYKVKFISYTEPLLGTENEMIRDIVLTVMGAMAKQERLRISERTKAGLETAKRRGKKLGRPRLKNTEKAIIELYNQGKKIREICKEVYYWDKNKHKKYVSMGFVHKTIEKFKQELNRNKTSEQMSN